MFDREFSRYRTTLMDVHVKTQFHIARVVLVLESRRLEDDSQFFCSMEALPVQAFSLLVAGGRHTLDKHHKSLQQRTCSGHGVLGKRNHNHHRSVPRNMDQSTGS